MLDNLNPERADKVQAARKRSAERLRDAGLSNAATVIEARIAGDEPTDVGDALTESPDDRG